MPIKLRRARTRTAVYRRSLRALYLIFHVLVTQNVTMSNLFEQSFHSLLNLFVYSGLYYNERYYLININEQRALKRMLISVDLFLITVAKIDIYSFLNAPWVSCIGHGIINQKEAGLATRVTCQEYSYNYVYGIKPEAWCRDKVAGLTKWLEGSLIFRNLNDKVTGTSREKEIFRLTVIYFLSTEIDRRRNII